MREVGLPTEITANRLISAQGLSCPAEEKTFDQLSVVCHGQGNVCPLDPLSGWISCATATPNPPQCWHRFTSEYHAKKCFHPKSPLQERWRYLSSESRYLAARLSELHGQLSQHCCTEITAVVPALWDRPQNPRADLPRSRSVAEQHKLRAPISKHPYLPTSHCSLWYLTTGWEKIT